MASLELVLGYAQSSPANASLLLFDASKGSFLSSYSLAPPIVSSTTTTTTLPGSTGTSRLPSGTGGSSGTHGSSPTSSGTPGDGGNGGNGGTDPQDKPRKSSATAVALGVVFGVLGLVAGGAAAYYMSTRRRGSHDSFHLLEPSDDDDSPHLGPVIPIAGAAGAREKGVPVMQNVKQKLVGLMPGSTAREQLARRDMLADEDTRVFEPSCYDVRREGSFGSWTSDGRHGVRPTLGDVVQGSLTSLRNVGGAVLAYAAGNRRKDASGASSNTYWEKDSAYQYSDKAALVALPSLSGAAHRPKGGKQASYTSQWSYEDPFADHDVEIFQIPEDEYDPDAIELKGAPSLDDPPPKPYTYSRVAPATADTMRLMPLSVMPSFQTLSDPTSSSSSDSSHAASPYNLPPSDASASRSSHDVPGSPRRPSSIIDANPPITANMRRSDSWWSRFTKTPLLDRARSTENSGRMSKPLLEFRDPNPPPRLVPIKESANSLSPQDSGSPTKRHHRHDSMYASVHHGRSATSLQTSKTADSAQMEQMGRTMDIVQKGTLSSHGSHASKASMDSGSSFEREPDEPGAPTSTMGPLSMFIPADLHTGADGDHGAAATASLVQSPTAMTPLSPSRTRPTTARAGSVAARVEAFEQHARPPPSPPSSSSRPKKGRQGVYGLAPKPSLFVANPDRRTSSGNS